LRRVSIGFLTLGSLPPGEFRPLTPQEVKRLRVDAGLGKPVRDPRRPGQNSGKAPKSRLPRSG